MNQDFSELIEYLDRKFEQTATKESVGVLQLAVQNLTVKVADLDVRVQDLGDRVRELETSVHALTNAIDKLAKAVDDLRIEYSAMAMQTTRHEKWIQQIAGKLGIKLEY